MRFPYEMPAAVCLALIAGGVGCAKSKEKPVASQDSMLMRDLAEANKNTAEAAAVDNSLNTVRTTGGGSEITASTTSQPRSSSNTQIVSRTASSGTPVLTSVARPAPPLVASDAPAPTTVPTELSPAGGSGDPCDSPAAVDQRSCLNRSIAENDTDLNRTYQELIAQSRKSGGAELEQRFREAQRNWVNQREAECRDSGEGALWARARARCLANYSERRTAELKRNLSSLRGQ